MSVLFILAIAFSYGTIMIVIKEGWWLVDPFLRLPNMLGASSSMQYAALFAYCLRFPSQSILSMLVVDSIWLTTVSWTGVFRL